MGAQTKIEWCHHTFNPWWGCQRVSPGCEHCYAETFDKRVSGKAKAHWGPSAARRFFGEKHWNDPVKWNLAARKAGERRRVFCASMADIFEDRPELVAERRRLFQLIRLTESLDWLLLTKRPENIARLWPASPGPSAIMWPNVWLGTTVEDQQRANERIPHLAAVRAAVRFLSCEPLLEALDLSQWLDEDRLGFVESPISWVIIGGESGAGARPFDLAWARSLVRQCRDGGRSVEPVPFVKQLGARGWCANAHLCEDLDVPSDFCDLYESSEAAGPCPGRCYFQNDRAGGDPSQWPADLRVREFPR